MRAPLLPVLLSALLATACASAPVRTDPATDCPGNALATVTNTLPYLIDVYYQEGNQTPSPIGEVSPGRTVTFHLPGVGNGRVTTQRPRTDTEPVTGQMRPSQPVRIRIHCAA